MADVAFIEFEIGESKRFHRVCAVFDALKEAKESGHWHDEQLWDYWSRLFDDKALATFWDYTKSDLAGLLVIGKKPRKPKPRSSLKPAWLFGSLIEAFRRGEYRLIACRRMSEEVGRLEFAPSTFPYGGTACMEHLIQAFGHRIANMEGT